MIWFFRDFLDGFTYLGVSIICIIFIMAIIGFMMERKQLEREKRNREAVLGGEVKASALGTVPIEDTTTYAVENSAPVIENVPTVATPESVIPEEVKTANAATNAKIPEILDLNAVEQANNNENSTTN